MTFNNTDILYASLVGSKVAEEIPRFTAVQNELIKHVLPPIPFLPFKKEVSINTVDQVENENLWRADAPLPEDQQFFPLTLIVDRQDFLLPYEPIINISAKNQIVRRYVNKRTGFGSVKERWSQDDYEITITGVLIGSILTGNVEDCFPREEFKKLKDYLTKAKRIEVLCEPLQLLGINYLAIDSFQFPFTKGENVQAYTIKAYSDDDISLIKAIREDVL